MSEAPTSSLLPSCSLRQLPVEEATEMTVIDGQCNERTCVSSFKHISSKPYFAESFGGVVCSSTKGKGAFQGGREIDFLCRHLEGVDKGLLGMECHI